ncbi:MAG: DUF4157 domain-containing protein [Methylophilaceae bacterium]
MFKQGRPLTPQEKQTFRPYFAENVIEQTRIIDGHVPFWLRTDMCAVVINYRIYLRSGVYQPNTKSGVELLGHELMHVSQFLHGMNWLKYIWSCRYGYKKSGYEIDAYAKGHLISANFQQLA